VIAGGTLTLAAEVPVASYFKLLRLPLAPVLGIGSLFLGIVLLGHLLYRPLKEERRRLRLFRAVLADDTSILPRAEPQPLPDENMLSLPCTFKLRRNWRGMAATSGAVALVAWVLLGATFVRILTPVSVIGWLGSTIICALCISAMVLLLLIKFTPLQWLEVTDEGVISYESGNPKTLCWEEIRLFVISSNQSKEEPPGRYQLFRKHGPGLALDVRRSPRQSLFQMEKPSLPFDEYDRQMNGLLSVIVAKTGLPLYDLR
jgi:hypothetical protein